MSTAFTVHFTAGAEQDLAEIHDWIVRDRGTEAGDAFLDRMLARVDSLSGFPDRGAVPPELDALGIGEFRQLSDPPWRIVYRVILDHVFVLLIADGRRDFRRLLERRLLAG